MKTIKNYKKIIAVVLMLSVILNVFSSCKDNKRKVTDYNYIISQYTNLSGDGELYTDDMGRLNYCDFSSMKAALLCSRPNCMHNDENNCSSYGMGNHPILLNDFIYFFQTETVKTDEGFSDITTVYKSDVDGTNRKEVCTIQDLNLAVYSRMLICNDKAYFPAERNEFDKYGNTTGYTTAYLCSFDLKTCEFVQLGELYHGYHGGSWLHGLFDGNIYISCGWSEVRYDTVDIDKLGEIENILMRYDVSEGIIEKADLTNPVYVGKGYFIYSDSSRTYILDENRTEISQCNMSIPDATIVNGKMFSSFVDICIDIKSDVTYSVNDYDGEIIAFNNNRYIIKHLDNGGYAYKSYTWDEIIGEELK